MEKLQSTIIHIYNEYQEKLHYKYFIINNKKYLFLTYTGMLKVIFTNRNKSINDINKLIMKKWLDNFDTIKINKYNLNIESENNKIGYVYLVTSNILDAVKIGMWRSNISSLYKRYITCYGSDIKIDYCLTLDARKSEKLIHNNFEQYNITNELFNKQYYNDYLNFINYNLIN